MPEICIYARRDGTWCAALRPSPGSPPCWWSHWSSQLERIITVARDEARRRFPDAADAGLYVGLWGPAAAGGALPRRSADESEL